MPTIVQDVIDFVAPFIGENGVCVNSDTIPLIITEMNRAIPLLMKRMDAKGTIAWWKVPLRSQTFTLPYDCLEPRQMFLNNVALEQRDQFYQGQLGVGLKCAGPWMCTGPQLIDEGDDFALPYDWPPHFDTRYGLVSEANSDAGKQVTVRFHNRLGDLLTEQVTLLPDQQIATTQSDVRDVVFQSKGQTNGAVRGYVFYPQTGQRVWIGTFPSFVLIPRYRKKRIPHCFPCGQDGVLVILGKIRYFPVQGVLDEIPISDPEAIGYACKALQAMRNSRFEEMSAALSLGLNELDKQNQDSESRGTVTQISVAAPLGRHAFTANHRWGWR